MSACRWRSTRPPRRAAGFGDSRATARPSRRPRGHHPRRKGASTLARVQFLCTGNSERSQMAEALCARLSNGENERARGSPPGLSRWTSTRSLALSRRRTCCWRKGASQSRTSASDRRRRARSPARSFCGSSAAIARSATEPASARAGKAGACTRAGSSRDAGEPPGSRGQEHDHELNGVRPRSTGS